MFAERRTQAFVVLVTVWLAGWSMAYGAPESIEAQEGEACCMPDGRCHMELPDECIQQGGVPQGPGSICLGDADGNGVDDACESLPLKWIQPPDINQTGIDVRASKPLILADDFLCTEQTLITDITVWGSWRDEVEPNYEQAGNVVFTLSLHADIPDPDPDDQATWSMPGQVLWIEQFQPGSFEYAVEQQKIVEWWMDPLNNLAYTPGDHVCWRYDFHIPADRAFCQEGTPDAPIVYWLDVQAEPMGPVSSEFGWKTSYHHWNDDAVWGEGEEPLLGPWQELRYPPEHIWQGESIDLAFSISGGEPCEPEGACCYGEPGTPTLCAITDQMTCEQQLNGQWMGPGTDCTDADGNGVADICEEQPGEMDFGDAPEGALAYPASGITGEFPTCMTVGPFGSWIQHTNFGAWFGPMVDFEPDGNAGLCPGFNPYDADECMNDGDAGLLIPGAYTIQAGTVAPCPQSPGGPLGSVCMMANWGSNIDIHVQNMMPNQTTGYVNVLADWNQDGKWAGASPCPTGSAPEHILVDFPVPNGFAGALSALNPAPFMVGPNAGHVWLRFSLTERPVGTADWDGSGVFEDGETEDYLLLVEEGPQEEMDFGDAPDRPYPTFLANNGARHTVVSGVLLGSLIDAEPDGQPTVNADGDDLANLADEDGVVFVTPLIPGQAATVQVTASVAGNLWAWIDFDANGSWAEAADQIVNGLPLGPGLNAISFMVPAAAQPGMTYCRFRFTTAAGMTLSYAGAAPDGEVEDHVVHIDEPQPEPMHDLGDAPDNTNSWGVSMTAYPGITAYYPTVFMAGSPPYGPLHRQPRAVAWLGQAVTLENEADVGPDQDPTNNINPQLGTADLDVADDGVQLPISLPHCGQTSFNFTMTAAAPGPQMYLNAWFDWNRDGDWDDTVSCPDGTAVPEWAVQDFLVPTPPTPGTYTHTTPGFMAFNPNNSVLWLRVTLSEQPWQPSPTPGSGGSGPSSGYEYGETEDYLVEPVVYEEWDFGDAPDPTYPTLQASNGASHMIVPGMFLGNVIDAEPDGQPTSLADGDDVNNLPDEDGVVFLTNLARGRPARVQVTASVPGLLDAWLDFNQNGSWADAIDQIFASVPLNPGANVLTFNVPLNAPLGTTFVRFRYSSAGGLPFTGPAQDGEVEDYMVKIVPAQVVGRYLFYNDSYWDGYDPNPGPTDDNAIAPLITALLPGQAATVSNYSSYDKRINGIMVDIADLAGTPTAADFAFLNTGRSATGAALVPAPSSVTVRPGAGTGGSDRVTIIWPNGAIPNTIWLKVTVLPTAQTGLAVADVFYFGNAVGESLSTSGGMALVNATDELDARNDPHTIFNPATIVNKHDYNRDRLVNATDELISRNHPTTIFNALVLVGSAPP